MEKGDGSKVLDTKIHEGARYGVEMLGSSCLIRDCEIFENVAGGVEVAKLADPTLRHCLIHDNKGRSTPQGWALLETDWGVRITDRSTGLLDDCEVYANGGIGLVVSGGANPTVRNSRFHDHPQHGIDVAGGRGNFEKPECYRNGNCGFLVQAQGDPKCIGADLHENGSKGLAIHGCHALFEDGVMRANGQAGVWLLEGSDAVIRRCKMLDGIQYGVIISSKASGTFEECETRGNRMAPTYVEAGCKPKWVQCQLR
jgi:hypothetical protein